MGYGGEMDSDKNLTDSDTDAGVTTIAQPFFSKIRAKNVSIILDNPDFHQNGRLSSIVVKGI